MIESDNSTDKSYEDQPILPLFPQQTATKQFDLQITHTTKDGVTRNLLKTEVNSGASEG